MNKVLLNRLNLHEGILEQRVLLSQVTPFVDQAGVLNAANAAIGEAAGIQLQGLCAVTKGHRYLQAHICGGGDTGIPVIPLI